MKILIHRHISDIFIIYLELFLIIFQSGSVYAATDHETMLFQITRLLMLILPLLTVVFRGIYNSRQVIMLFVLLQFTSLVNLFLYPVEFIVLEYKLILVIIFFLLIAYCFQHNYNLIRYLYNILLLIVVITLMIYIPVELLKLNAPFSLFKGSDSTVIYKNYFGFFFTYSTKKIPRISGFFWEPGVYEIYLNLTLYFYIILHKKNKIHLFVILSSIILCQSTLGWIIGLMLVGYLVIYGKNYNKQTKNFILLFIAVGVLIASGTIFVIKRLETNVIGDSYYMRILDIISALKVFAKSPLIGVGYGNVNAFIAVANTMKGSSNGFLSWLYMTGILGMTIVMYPFIKNSIICYKLYKKFDWWLFTVLIILFNFGEPFYNLPMMAFLLSIAFYKLLNPKFNFGGLCK